MLTNDQMKMLGEAILYASMQFAIGSVEMSSKFSVRNFCKDDETLQSATDALRDYMVIGTIWTIGVCMFLYASFGMEGLYAGLITNAAIMTWIYKSYMVSFKDAEKRYNLKHKPFIQL